MSLRLTARHRARLAAMQRIQEILAEQAELYAWYPELRADPRRPGVIPHDSSPDAPLQAQNLRAVDGPGAFQSPHPGHSTKKYSVF